jgi:DNA-directed RNA polymerase specialized sigma24 family protein
MFKEFVMSKKKSKNVHYINNQEFSQAVVNYVTEVKKSKEKDESLPVVPDYIAISFLRIAENLSHKSNFIRYTYREEMVMDAVENCLKAIENYDINAETRTGKPNAFAYFTQIIWYAFLRRIQKEKRQQDIKEKYLSQSGVEAFIANELADDAATQVATHFIDTLKDRIDKVKAYDTEIKEFAKTTKKKKKRAVHVDSDLTEFLE